MYEALGDIRMRSFITNFYRIIDMCKKFAGNRVNNLSNIPRRGVAPPNALIPRVHLLGNGSTIRIACTRAGLPTAFVQAYHRAISGHCKYRKQILIRTAIYVKPEVTGSEK